MIDFEKHFGQYHPLFADEVARGKGGLKILKNAQIIEELHHGLIIGLGAGDITYQLRGTN